MFSVRSDPKEIIKATVTALKPEGEDKYDSLTFAFLRYPHSFFPLLQKGRI